MTKVSIDCGWCGKDFKDCYCSGSGRSKMEEMLDAFGINATKCAKCETSLAAGTRFSTQDQPRDLARGEFIEVTRHAKGYGWTIGLSWDSQTMDRLRAIDDALRQMFDDRNGHARKNPIPEPTSVGEGEG